MNKSIFNIYRIGLYSIFTYLVFILLYNQTVNFGYITDMRNHLERILPIVNGEYYLPHSMFHYLVYWSHSLANSLSINISLGAVMILLQVFLLIIITEITFRIIKYFLENKYNDYIIFLIALSLQFIGSICAPFINKFFLLGTGNPNTWHNPTTFMIKPFMLLCIFGIYLLIQKSKIVTNLWFCFVLSTLFALSIWAKPSFAISFYPALAVFLLLFNRFDYKLYFRIFIILLPSLIFLTIQYFQTYYSQLTQTSDLRNNIVFTFFGVIRLFSNNIFISLLLAIAFPLSIFILDYKEVIKNKLLVLTWLNTVFAYLEMAFLAEKFSFGQGAFCFGYSFALFLLFIFSTVHLFEYLYKNRTNRIKPSGNIMLILFMLHLFCGVYYYFHYLVVAKNFF